MSLSIEDRESLSKLGTLTKAELSILNAAIGDMHFRAKTSGIVLAKDDREAAMEAALVRYILASRRP